MGLREKKKRDELSGKAAMATADQRRLTAIVPPGQDFVLPPESPPRFALPNPDGSVMSAAGQIALLTAQQIDLISQQQMVGVVGTADAPILVAPNLGAKQIGKMDREGKAEFVGFGGTEFSEVIWKGGRNPPVRGFMPAQFVLFL